jgi:hypothetical protein
MDDGWTYGPERDDAKKTHLCLVLYADVPEEEKAYDRQTAVETLKAVQVLGHKIVPADPPGAPKQFKESSHRLRRRGGSGACRRSQKRTEFLARYALNRDTEKATYRFFTGNRLFTWGSPDDRAAPLIAAENVPGTARVPGAPPAILSR